MFVKAALKLILNFVKFSFKLKYSGYNTECVGLGIDVISLYFYV